MTFPLVASLGMYDFGPASAANDRLWAVLRDGLRLRGLQAPESLTRGEAAYWQAWQSPGLVLSQTCGYPFRARLYPNVTLIGAPDYGLPGCPPGHYNSVFVARKDDPRDGIEAFAGAGFAFNEALSQSGWAAPMTHLADLQITVRPSLQTGGHRLSARAVAAGKADLAALDAQSWAMLQADEPAVQALKVVGRTSPTPALPFIAARGADQPAIFAALAAAIAGLSPPDRRILGLRGLIALPAEAYLAVPNPPPPPADLPGN